MSSAPVVRAPTLRVGSLRRLSVEWLPVIAVFVVGLAAWQGAIYAFDIQRFLLPKPTSIATTFWHERETLWSAGWYTFQEALGGFAIGGAAGLTGAIVLARWRPLSSALMPYFIAANAIPIIAFVPIMNAWFGVEKGSKVATAAVLCFLPVLVNTLRGLTSVHPSSVDLMHSYAASELEIFSRLRIPKALPYAFSSLRIATVLAMIGAIAGEFFGGSQRQLGILIKNSTALFQFELAWAAVVIACIFGVGFYLAVVLAERLVTVRFPSRPVDVR